VGSTAIKSSSVCKSTSAALCCSMLLNSAEESPSKEISWSLVFSASALVISRRSPLINAFLVLLIPGKVMGTGLWPSTISAPSLDTSTALVSVFASSTRQAVYSLLSYQRKAKSKEQRAKSKEQRAKSKEQRAKSKEQRAKSKDGFFSGLGQDPFGHLHMALLSWDQQCISQQAQASKQDSSKELGILHSSSFPLKSVKGLVGFARTAIHFHTQTKVDRVNGSDLCQKDAFKDGLQRAC